MQVEGREYVLKEGEALFINSGLIHVTTSISEDGQYEGFMFPEKLLGFSREAGWNKIMYFHI